jgi:hypothetical protein
LFTALGGFDPIFSPAYFEDADLAFRIADIGLFVYCCPQSTIYHQECATSRVVWTEGQLLRLAHRNRDLFFDRWQHDLIVRAESSAPPRRKYDGRSWSAMRGESSAASTAIEPTDLRAARNFAQLDRQVGFLSAVLSCSAGVLGQLRGEFDDRISARNAIRILLNEPSNADRIDLKENEARLDTAITTLSERIAVSESQTQREMAMWNAARQERRLISRE